MSKDNLQRKEEITSPRIQINDCSSNQKSNLDKIGDEAENHFYLGQCFEFGSDGYPENLERAYEEYLMAAELGHSIAMVFVGYDYTDVDDSILGYDIEKAEKWGKSAIQYGNPDGYSILFKVQEALNNLKEASNILDIGCSKGSLDCIENKAYLLCCDSKTWNKIIKPDKKLAFKLLESVEWDDDYWTALELLGYFHWRQNNIQLAIEYYERSLSSNPENYDVMIDLGDIFRTEEGVKDYKRALQLYRTVIDSGDSKAYEAMNSYGIMLFLGQGTDSDTDEAINWLTKSAQGGYRGAMTNLGDFLWVCNKRHEALEWYKQAANKDNVSAQARLEAIHNDSFQIDLLRSEAIYENLLGDIVNILLSNPLPDSDNSFFNYINIIKKTIDKEDLSDYDKDRLKFLDCFLRLMYFHEHFFDKTYNDYVIEFYTILHEIIKIIPTMSIVSDESIYLLNITTMYLCVIADDPLDKLKKRWSHFDSIKLDENYTEFKIAWWEKKATEVYELMFKYCTKQKIPYNESKNYLAVKNNYLTNRIIRTPGRMSENLLKSIIDLKNRI